MNKRAVKLCRAIAADLPGEPKLNAVKRWWNTLSHTERGRIRKRYNQEEDEF